MMIKRYQRLLVGGLWIALFSDVLALEFAPLDTYTANLASNDSMANVTCLIEPSMVVDLGTPVEGVLETVSVDRSDVVREGQVVARLRSHVERAEIAYQDAKAEYARRKIARSEDLRRKQLISEQDLDDMTTEQHLSELELRQKKAILKQKEIRSTLDGVVVDRFKNPGDLVAKEQILRVARINPLYAELVLPADYFGRVKQDSQYSIFLLLSKTNIDGEVVAVDKVIDPASGTFRVRVALPNNNNLIPSGQRCRIFLD